MNQICRRIKRQAVFSDKRKPLLYHLVQHLSTLIQHDIKCIIFNNTRHNRVFEFQIAIMIIKFSIAWYSEFCLKCTVTVHA